MIVFEANAFFFLCIACLVRSSIELNDQVFSGSYAVSQKCGKHGSQANTDETYILQVLCKECSNTQLTLYE
jgi:hypothetical protein